MISTVAVGTDGSATAAEAVKVAADMARRFDAELVLISASRASKGSRSGESVELQWASNPTARAREILVRAEEDARANGLSCRTMIDEGDPADVLVRLATECDADVLVIGNKGMKRKVLGSVPNTVSHNAGCHVLIVKTT